ncbi:MAG: DUF1343 domain-containing protein, partial [Cyclobacteriaceae bacterium]
MQIKVKHIKYPIFHFSYLVLLLVFTSCQAVDSPDKDDEAVVIGNARFDKYLPLLKNKRVGLVVNQSSLVNNTHLVDTLLSRGINVAAIFAPEHGFRGEAADGITVADGTDVQTGIPVFSLYGKVKKPTTAHMAKVDIMVFDIQDVGTRFYTYLSTMHWAMEACAENNKSLVVLDKPNPNAHYVDGPILELEHQSIVGMHPIPVVHGMTLGELARMINGEKWLAGEVQCELTVVPVLGWSREDTYHLPVRPSPNLPDDQAIAWYPSLCFFEGTIVSVGRGTDHPFTRIGHPAILDTSFSFTPVSRQESVYPKHEGKTCYGIDLRKQQPGNQINLTYLIDYYQKLDS